MKRSSMLNHRRPSAIASPRPILGIAACLLACFSMPLLAVATPPATPAAEEVADPVIWTVQRPADVARASLEIAFVVEPRKDAKELEDAQGNRLFVAAEPIVTGLDVQQVEVAIEPDFAHYAVTLHFTPEAASRLHSATAGPPGQRVAIIVDGKVLLTPVVQTPLSSTAMISSGFSRQAAIALAERLAP
ncbi:MAG TPA: hypothetical protein VFS60_19445 [Thermoanaerobaculia bacterium]|nr:hypothetical protein [Thermoanaerobaculia bacterium]